MQQDLYIPCTIRRSPFSGERFVQSIVPGLEYRGAVPTRYCSADEKTVPEGPAKGYLRALLSSRTARRVTISMPDGTFVKVCPSVIAGLETRAVGASAG